MSGYISTHPSVLPDQPTHDLYNRTGDALVAGDVVALDVTGSATEAVAYSVYDSAIHRADQHPFRNVIGVAAAHDDGWIFLVALEPIEDNAEGKFGLYGTFSVKIADSIAIGAFLAPSATNVHLVASADGLARVAQALEANASGGVAARPCIFEGRAAFGPEVKMA